MLNEKFAAIYQQLYEATEEQALSPREEAMVGLTAAIALDCEPCASYYLDRCKNANISDEDLGHILAKVMLVSAGQKKLLMKNLKQ